MENKNQKKMILTSHFESSKALELSGQKTPEL